MTILSEWPHEITYKEKCQNITGNENAKISERPTMKRILGKKVRLTSSENADTDKISGPSISKRKESVAKERQGNGRRKRNHERRYWSLNSV